MGYIKQAPQLHVHRHLPSPKTADLNYIKIMTDAVKKWEAVPKRQEMISDSMFHYMVKLYGQAHPDSLVASLCEWCFLGRYTGFRKSEWCSDHPHEYAKILDPEWGNKPNAIPLIAEDLTFLGPEGQYLGDIDNFADSDAAFNHLRIRHQKNNDNYQTLTYYRDITHTVLCPTQCCLNITRRARRLHLPAFHPVAIYYDFATKQRKQITSKQVVTFLRMVASKVFCLSASHPDLQKWSCHSIRVTAANLLHKARYSDSFIKNCLRWKSDTFLMYLRNTFYTAEAHTKAITLNIKAPTADELRPLEMHEHYMSTGAA